MVQALAARGCADVALDVMRARTAGGGADSLDEAEVALSIRLLCNLVTEAFMEVAVPATLPFSGVLSCAWCSEWHTPI